MRSLFKVIKSSQLVFDRSREIKCPAGSAANLNAALSEKAAVLAVEDEDSGNMEKIFGPEEAAAIIAETEAMVKELLEKAEARAKEIVNAAREEAAQLIEQAKEEAKRIREENRRRGYQEGREQSLKEMEAIKKQKLKELEDIIYQAQQEKEDLLKSLEPDVVNLAVSIAEKILRSELESRPELIVGMVREALQQVNGHSKGTIKVQERFLPFLQGSWAEIFPNGSGKGWKVEADDTVDAGGCIIENEAGYVDAQLTTQVEAIKEALEQVKNSA